MSRLLQTRAANLNSVFSAIFLISAISLFALPTTVGAQGNLNNYGLGQPGFQALEVGKQSDLYTVTAQMVNIILGFLGVIAVLGIIFGGLKIMTAGGNEDQTSSGRTAVVQSAIGLFIIFAAWGIASLDINALRTATN